MPSRKKAKGKARKAAKKAKAKEEESRAVVEVAANKRQEGSLEAQLHQLVISDIEPRKCEHGLIQLSAGEEKICLELINAYLHAFTLHDVPGRAGQAIFVADQATSEEYADVYSSKLDTVLSMILASGTQSILDGRNDIARRYAMLAFYFEDILAETRENQGYTKLVELGSADDHTLVSYYRKRIPCACLDDKYKEVKSIKKMGICHNLNCSHPDGKVERSKMLSCSRCGVTNYCSVECQRAHWKEHKEVCSIIADIQRLS